MEWENLSSRGGIKMGRLKKGDKRQKIVDRRKAKAKEYRN